jgi:alkanesulfonate monooxygenase SsuD/methylene tetrahydromethanopterin reductase-like flavin-dependent oxidoreductase (luciferase family)
LFGYDLAGYEELFDEKATLFAELIKGRPVTWEGKTRSALLNQDVVPHTESGPFPTWIGVGGNPQSVIRAARLGFSLMLAIIGGPPARFAAYSQLFQRALEKSGRRRSRWACTRRATSRLPTNRLKRSSGRAGARSSPWSRRSAASRFPPRNPSTGKPGHTEHCMSAHPKPSRRRSPRTSAPWGPLGST